MSATQTTTTTTTRKWNDGKKNNNKKKKSVAKAYSAQLSKAKSSSKKSGKRCPTCGRPL